VIPEEVTRAVALAINTLSGAIDADWQVPAAGLTWTCWETVEHMSDDLFAYAAQLGPAKPSLSREVPIGWQYRRDGGPALAIFVDPPEGPRGQVAVLEVCGALLAAMVATAPSNRLAHHVYGASDPGGFAAMGVVEVLVHMYDVAGGLGLAWEPPADLCERAVADAAMGDRARRLPDHLVQTSWR
jgi:Mycothiol maleylpyruvate isomerase N-terminal domain